MTTEITEIPRLVRPAEMARILAVSTPTLRRLSADGVIPSVRVGSHRRYDPVAVMTAIRGGVE